MKRCLATAVRGSVWAAAALLMAAPCYAGNHTWTGAVNGYWSVAGNWSEGVAPSAGENQVTLVFNDLAVRRQSTNNLAGLTVSSLTFLSDNFRLSGAGGGTLLNIVNGAILCIGDGNALENSLGLVLHGNPAFSIGDQAIFEVRGQLSGDGGFSKAGDGALHLLGTANNTYTGPTTVNAGSLFLGHGVLQSGLWQPRVAIPGALTVGTATTNLSPTVYWLLDHQVSSNSVLTLNESGYVHLMGCTQSFAGLNLRYGLLDTRQNGGPSGLLRVSGQVNEYKPAVTRTNSLAGRRSGRYAFTAGSHTVFVAAGTSVQWLCSIGETGGPATFHKTGPGEWSLAAQTNTFSGAMHVDEGVLYVSDFTPLGSTNGGTYVANGAQLRVSTDVIGEALTLDGMGMTNLLHFPADYASAEPATLHTHEYYSWTGPVTLTSDALIYVGRSVDIGSAFTLSGSINGTGGLTKTGAGRLRLSGGGAISTPGAFKIRLGELELNKNLVRSPGPALAGPLEVGHAGAVSGDSRVSLLADHQFNHSSAIALHDLATFNLNGHTTSVGQLTLSRCWIEIGTDFHHTNGLLTLGGFVTVTGSLSQVSGNVSLGGATRNVQLVGGATLALHHDVRDGSGVGGLNVSGNGVLELGGSNSFSGALNIQSGTTVEAYFSDRALGTASGATTVHPGGALFLFSCQITNESLVVGGVGPDEGAIVAAGPCVWAGPIALSQDTVVDLPYDSVVGYGRLDIYGPVSGPGGIKVSGRYHPPGSQEDYVSRVRFGGSTPNTYTGPTLLDYWSKLELAKSAGVIAVPAGLQVNSNCVVRWLGSEQLANAQPVLMQNEARLTLNGFNETMGSLAGGGTVSLGAGNVAVGLNGSNTAYAGNLIGSNGCSFTKLGVGSLTLSGNNTFPGQTYLQTGQLIVNGSQTGGGISVMAGTTLGGHGSVGSINSVGGTISPGSSPGRLSTGPALLDADSRLAVELNASGVAIGYDQLNLTGGVDLGGAKLQVKPGFTPALNHEFMILQNDGADAVVGTFADRPENSVFVSEGRIFRINYGGGTGNDVVLTYLGAVSSTQIEVVRLNGGMQMTGSGFPGLAYDVLASTNLSSDHWIKIGSITANAGGLLQFTVNDMANYPQRFYQFYLP